MVATTTHFPKQKAPCGHMVDGDHHIERDDEGLAYDDLKFSCGCREIRVRTIRHDGKVLKDEHSGDHEA